MAGVGITYSEGGGATVRFRHRGAEVLKTQDTTVLAAGSCLGIVTSVLNAQGENVGGYAAEYVGVYTDHIGPDKAQEEATIQLEQSIDHELSIRGFTGGERKIFNVEYVEVNATDRYAYTLNAIGFVEFENATP